MSFSTTSFQVFLGPLSLAPNLSAKRILCTKLKTPVQLTGGEGAADHERSGIWCCWWLNVQLMFSW